MSKDVWPGIGLTAKPFDWANFHKSSASSARSTAAVEKKRKDGTDLSTIHGLSRKDRRSRPPTRMRQGPEKYGVCQPDSLTGKARQFLANGPKTRKEIAEGTGVSYKNVNGIFANDIKKGRVVVLRDTKPQRYALGVVT